MEHPSFISPKLFIFLKTVGEISNILLIIAVLLLAYYLIWSLVEKYWLQPEADKALERIEKTFSRHE